MKATTLRQLAANLIARYGADAEVFVPFVVTPDEMVRDHRVSLDASNEAIRRADRRMADPDWDEDADFADAASIMSDAIESIHEDAYELSKASTTEKEGA